MKAFEQYVHVVLFIMLYKVVLTFKSVDESLVCNHLNESYWAVFYLVLFIILFEVFLIVVETLVFDYSPCKESYRALLLCAAAQLRWI